MGVFHELGLRCGFFWTVTPKRPNPIKDSAFPPTKVGDLTQTTLRHDRNAGGILPVIYLLRGDHEAVAFAVLEDCEGAPRFFLRRTVELHPARGQFLVGLLDVIAHERRVHERADAVFVRIRGEEHHPRLGLGHAQFDPALFLVEGLIGDDGEPEFLRIRIQRPV